MSLIYKGQTVANVGGGSGGVTMDQVNAAIQDAVADIQPQEVYSTEETRIGTWIDGKPLYRKCGHINSIDVVSLGLNIPSVKAVTGLNVDTLVMSNFFGTTLLKEQCSGVIVSSVIDGDVAISQKWSENDITFTDMRFVLEYTKTTD